MIAEEIEVRLRARMDDYERQIELARRNSDKAFNAIGGASSRAEADIRANSARISSSLKSIVGVLAGSFTGRELIGLQDSFIKLQNNLRVAGIEGDNLKTVQDRLFASAQKYGVELEGLSSLFSSVSQASKELGASQEQVFGITNAVSGALKVTGISAQEASGALLQLGQALRGGKVQAEEYNSLLDGLYPLLEAAANGSDRFGGSVAKLTAAVKDGKVSSREFFNAILAGADVLENKAAKATLTTAAGLTSLSNALTVYFGEADRAQGVSAALGEALGLLADNLDTLIPAIGVLSVAAFGRFAAGALAGGTALRTVAAYSSIATTSLAGTALAARGAGAALLAAFGGPVGVAITALTLGIGYAITRTSEASSASKTLQNQSQATATAIGKLNNILEQDPSKKVAGDANALAAARRRQADETFRAAQAEISLRRSQAQARLKDLEDGTVTTRVNRGRAGTVAQEETFSNRALGLERAKARNTIKQSDTEQKALDAALANARKIIANPPAASAGGVSTDKPKGKTAKGPTGPSADEIAQQYARDLRQIVARDLSARLSLAASADQRAEIENRLLNDEIRSSAEEINGNKQYSAAQKAKLLAELKSQELSQRAQIERDRQDQNARDAADVSDASIRNQRDLLDADSRLAETRAERRDIELQLLDYAYQQERHDLEAVVASQTAAQAQKDIAAARLAILDQLKARDTASVNRENESPIERYKREGASLGRNINDEVESVQVRALDRLSDGIADAGAEYVKLGGIAGNVINGIIRDLLRLAAQQAIVSALGGALGGGITGNLGGSSGGFGSGRNADGSYSLFSSGGYTGDGPRDQVAGVVHKGEYVVPASAVNRIGVANLEAMANGQAASSMAGVSALPAASQGGGSIKVQISLDNDMLSAQIVNTSVPVAVEVVRQNAGAISQNGANLAISTLTRPRLG